MPLIALTRPVPRSLEACELTHLERTPIDVVRAAAQHEAYEHALRSLGCSVLRIPASPDHPDSVFVEDTAVVLDEVAIITRPGAQSRRGETAAVAQSLSHYRELRRISEPATMDGGDVLRLGRVLYVGVGARTNGTAVEQLRGHLTPFGYEVEALDVDGCLHLKSAVTELRPGLVLINPAWVEARRFAPHQAIEVDPLEPFAANVLRIGDDVLSAAAHERTNARLRSAGLSVATVDVSELAKAEAGLTCCSLVFRA